MGPGYAFIASAWGAFCVVHVCYAGIAVFFVVDGVNRLGRRFCEEYPVWERWAERFGVRGGLLVARGLTLCVLGMSLMFYNVFRDRAGTWKEDWAGELV